MQMARSIGTTVLRRKFRRGSAIAGDRRARLNPGAGRGPRLTGREARPNPLVLFHLGQRQRFRPGSNRRG